MADSQLRARPGKAKPAKTLPPDTDHEEFTSQKHKVDPLISCPLDILTCSIRVRIRQKRMLRGNQGKLHWW